MQARDSRTVQRRGQGHGFTTDYPLRDLKPGPYVLAVEAVSATGGHSARREILFDVK